MQLNEFIDSVDGFAKSNHAHKIKLFGWYLHTYRARDSFTASEIAACFSALSIAPPSDIHPFLSAMAKRRPPQALKTAHGFRLERQLRSAIDSKHGTRLASLHIHNLIADLPHQIGGSAEREFLEECFRCFKVGAFRAAIVMCWNLGFDHLCQFILKNHLQEFNTQLPQSFPRADVQRVSKVDDFQFLKEAQVIQIAASATIISKSVQKVLKEKLDRRNIAAHPSGIIVSQLTAEEFIKDLIENVVLKLV